MWLLTIIYGALRALPDDLWHHLKKRNPHKVYYCCVVKQYRVWKYGRTRQTE